MSYRDRQGQSPSLYDSNNNGKRDPRRPARDSSERPSRQPSGNRPWHVDPADVDRYLAEREQALRLERPDRYGSGRRPTDPTNATTDRSSLDNSSRVFRGSPQHTPPPAPSDIQWPDLDDEPWSDDGDELTLGHEEEMTRPAAAPRSRARTSTRTSTRSRAPRSAPQIQVPRFVAGAAIANDRPSLLLLAVTVASAIVLWIVFGARVGHVGSVVPLHLDAVGIPDRWGPAKVLWRLPLLATMLPLMTLAVAWVVARFDRFAGRYLLATGLCLQFFVWVAAIRLLW